MLSKTSQYAIRAVVFIAKKQGEKVKVTDIAEQLKVPGPFLSKILQQLAKRSILTSIKGPYGGFYIEKEKMNIRLQEVIDLFDGENHFQQCVLGFPDCSETNPCAVHVHYAKIRATIENEILDQTINDIVSDKSYSKL